MSVRGLPPDSNTSSGVSPRTATSRPQLVFTPHAPPGTADAVGLDTLRAVTPPAKKARRRASAPLHRCSAIASLKRPYRGGRPRQCCFPPPGFSPCTPFSGRPPFKTRNPAGGKTFLGGNSTAAITARLTAWGLYRRDSAWPQALPRAAAQRVAGATVPRHSLRRRRVRR